MLKLKKVAVTGTLGAGKSTACEIFKKLGAYTLDCDKYVHEILDTNPEIIKQTTDLLGDRILTEGRIDRKKVALLVFNDSDLLNELQNILFPEIKQWLVEEYNKASSEKWPLYVVEAPLLFEAKWEDDFDVTVGITAEPSVCKKRSHLQKEEYEKRVRFHKPDKEKMCDIIIYNNEDAAAFEEKINQLFTNLTK